MKKLMSILLTVSLMAVMVIIPTTASAANNPVPYKQIVYSQDFNDASNVQINNTTAFTTLPGGTWCGYDATAVLEARSQETPDDMCLNSPYAGSKLFIWTFPSAIPVTDDATYELSFDYYASGDEIVYLATPNRADTYVRMQSGNALSRNQWNTVTMIFNAANHTISVNGVGNSGTWNAAESYTRFMVVHNGGAVKIDNFKMYKYVYTPTVEGVSFIDNLGNEITDFENMSPSVSSIKININNAADVDEILDNFYIFDEANEEEVVLGDDATYENNVFTVSLPDGLKANCNYSINVDSDLKNSKGETGVGAYIEFSTTASAVSATLTANAPDTYSTDKWKTQWSKTFDTSADFAIDGEYQNRAGFINELNSLEYDSTNQCMKTTTSNIPRFDVNLPVQYSSVAGTAIVLMPDRVRYSFDVKLDDTADFYISLYGFTQIARNAENTDDLAIRFTEFGGETISRNNWQRYTIELIPNNINGAQQHVKVWRGDESYYSSASDIIYRYPNTNYQYVHWVRITQKTAPTTDDVYFDNFKFERRRYIFTCDFSPNSYGIVSKTFEPAGVPGFITLGGTVTDGQQLMVDASSGNTEIMRVWLAGMYTSGIPVKFSFDLKTDDENLINLLIRFGANTDDVSSTYVVNGDTNVGGATFSPGTWQRYNFIIVPSANGGENYTITAWRGGESDKASAITTTFVMPNNRTNVSNISLINGIAADATYYIDNVVAERFFADDGFEATNPVITSVTANIDNYARYASKYLLIAAGYDADDNLKKVVLKEISLTSSDTAKVDTLTIPADIFGFKTARMFLWEKDTIIPLTTRIEVK